LRHRTDICIETFFSSCAQILLSATAHKPIVFDLLEDLIGPLNLELIVCVSNLLLRAYNATTDASTTRIATLVIGCANVQSTLTAIISNDVLSNITSSFDTVFDS
jgi:hypothetical protein